MEIKIPLNVLSSAKTYQEIKAQLKQLELSVHHAQKAVESAEKGGVPITDDAYLAYDYSALKFSLDLDTQKEKNETLSAFIDNYWDELQSPELIINIQ